MNFNLLSFNLRHITAQTLYSEQLVGSAGFIIIKQQLSLSPENMNILFVSLCHSPPIDNI